MATPPPSAEAEHKSQSNWGRVYDYSVSPSAIWAGGIIVKFLLVWFVFIGLLGIFMRVHSYAWGENGDANDNNKGKER